MAKFSKTIRCGSRLVHVKWDGQGALSWLRVYDRGSDAWFAMDAAAAEKLRDALGEMLEVFKAVKNTGGMPVPPRKERRSGRGGAGSADAQCPVPNASLSRGAKS